MSYNPPICKIIRVKMTGVLMESRLSSFSNPDPSKRTETYTIVDDSEAWE